MHGSTLKSCRKSPLGESSVLVGNDSGGRPFATLGLTAGGRHVSLAA
jgi:hypothetical protein